MEVVRIREQLYHAVSTGDAGALQQLLDQDPLVLDRVSLTDSGKSALHIAAENGNLPFVQEILARAPQLSESFDSQQSSPLHLASAKGYEEIVDLLSSAAPDSCFLRDSQGMNPVHLAAIKGKTEVLAVLVGRTRAAAMEKADRGQTVLHLCVKHNQRAAFLYLLDIVKELVHEEDDEGNGIMHTAVRYQNAEMIRDLIARTSISKNATDSRGRTPLDILEQCESSAGISPEIWNILGPRQKHPLPSKWLEKRLNTLMVVAILVATMAFQSASNPPGGVWQDDLLQDSQGHPVPNPHRAGEAVMAYSHPRTYRVILAANTIAFASSIFQILLIICIPRQGFKIHMIAHIMSGMAISSAFMAYVLTIRMITPHRNIAFWVPVVVYLLFMYFLFYAMRRAQSKRS